MFSIPMGWASSKNEEIRNAHRSFDGNALWNLRHGSMCSSRIFPREQPENLFTSLYLSRRRLFLLFGVGYSD